MVCLHLSGINKHKQTVLKLTTFEMITDCKILIRFTYRAQPHEDNKSYVVEFSSFPDFVNYLIWEPERGALVGFGTLADEPVKSNCNSNVSLGVSYCERGSAHEVFCKTFQSLTDFLAEHAAVAEKLLYKIN